MSTQAGRTLPHSLEAEKAVLGACLMNADAYGEAAEVLKPRDFFRDAHRRLFEAMATLHEAGTELDTVTVKNELVRRGDVEEVGGPAYVASLTDGVPRSSNVAHYARIVQEKAELRNLIHAATKISAAAYEAEDDSRAILTEAEKTLFELAGRGMRGGFVSLRDLMPRLLERIEQASQTKTGITGLATGLTELDDMTSGFKAGQIILIAARPSQGKSALAGTIALNVSKRGKVVGANSLEMSDEEWGMRALAGETGINGRRIESGFLGERDWGKLAQALGTLGELPLHIDDSADVNAFDIRTRARRLRQEHGLDLLIVDYTQLVSGDGKAQNREQEIARISRMMKRIAKEMRIPVILLSQLSREVEKRQDKRPILSDLRESGALEQDADIVIFIHREEQYQQDPDPSIVGVAELIVAKQRNGPTGTVKVHFRKDTTTFENLVPEYADQRLPMEDR